MDTHGKKRREPGVEEPLHDPFHPSDDEANDDYDNDDDDDSNSSSDLGIQDADNASSTKNTNGNAPPNGTIKHAPTDLSPEAPRLSQSTTSTGRSATTNGSSDSSLSRKHTTRQAKRTEERKQRGLMQWKPARNARFAKDQGKLGLSKLKKKLTGGLDGRQPGVETETGT